MTRARHIAWALCALGCRDEVPLAHLLGDASVDASRDVSRDVAVEARADGDAPSACDETMRCRSTVSTGSFRYAICTCSAWTSAATVRTDAIDSARGMTLPTGVPAGSVGTNGEFSPAGDVTLGGALRVGGGGGVHANGTLRVATDLRSNGAVSGPGDVTAGNVWANGAVHLGSLTVAGTVTLPAGADLSVDRPPAVSRVVRAPVSVPPPCDCAAPELAAVAARAQLARGDNDDLAAGVSADLLARVDRPERVTLPCGRYYFTGIRGNAPLTLALTGRAEVVIDGDVSVDDLRVELGPAGEVDLLVAGSVNVGRSLVVGSPAAPARARMFVLGAGVLALAGRVDFAGNLYAPRTELRVSGDVEVYGALLVDRLAASAGLTVHYDVSVLEPGADCPPAARCASCRECPGAACIGGACGPCRADDDCCAPFFCAAGRCLPAPP